MFKNMHPFSIEVENEIDLYLLKDGRYQIINKGSLSPIMIGYKYILVENAIAEYFKELEIEKVSFKPAIILNPSSGIEYFNYQEMVINHHFESSQINDINISGVQFLLMDNRYLFTSPELKDILKGSNLRLIFSEGLSRFGE